MNNKLKGLFSKKYFQNTILAIFILFFIVALFATCTTVFDTHASQIMKIIIGSFYFCLAIFLGLIYRIKPHILLFFFSVIFVVINSITIIFNSGVNSYKILALGDLILIFINFYLLFSVFPRILSKKHILVFIISVSTISLISCFYSLIVEHENIFNLFTRSGSDIVNPNYQIKSIFAGKNVFGFYLFGSLLSLILLLKEFKGKIKIYFWFSLVVNSLFLFLSQSKTPLFLFLLLLLFLFFKFVFNNFRERKIQSILLISVLVVIISSLICCISIEKLYFHSDLLKYFRTVFYKNSLNSLKSRLSNLSNIKSLISFPRVLIGFGFKVSMINYEQTIGLNAPLDCAYAYSLLSGGVLYILFIIFAYFTVISRFCYIYKRNKSLGVDLILFCIVITLYGFFENIQLISASIDSFVFGLLLLTYPGAVLRNQNFSNCDSKKILHVVGSLDYGGTEAFVYNYLVELKKAGYQFDIYCFNKINNDVRKKFESCGCFIYEGIKPNKLNFIRTSIQFTMILAKSNYGSIHLNANFDSAVFSNCSYDMFVPNIICHAHDTLTNIEFSGLQKLVMWFKRNILVFCGSQFLACSENAGNDIFKEKFFKNNGEVMYNGINFDNFRNINNDQINKLKKEFNIPEDKIILGNITRFETKKNQEFLINLIKSLSENYFLILGGVDGGNLNSIQMLASGCKNVVFIGERSDVNVWLKIFDYYLFPSLYEGLGIVAIESQLSGLMTIVSENVPDEADLKCGLFKKIELNNEKWKDAVKIKPSKFKIDFEKESIKKYDIKECVEKLKLIYEKRKC